MTDTTQSGKADFGGVYNQPDPRAYYATLSSHGYEIPQHGVDVIARLLDIWSADGANGSGNGTGNGAGQPTVLDVCCSYGVGGALLKTDLRLDDLYAHYRSVAGRDLDGEALVRADRELLARHQRPGAPRVVGLDIADNAIAYGVAAGALDDGVAADLETDPPPASFKHTLAGVDLVATTGGVGYVSERTFARILEALEHTPRVAAFCLRQYDYSAIAELLSGYGLVTEKATSTFHQRRFADDEEKEWAISQITERGLDPEGFESDGHYHAELYVSRPAHEVATRSLDQLAPGL